MQSVAISVDGSHIHIHPACAKSCGNTATLQIGIHESSEILILAATLLPKIVQLQEYTSRHADGSPDPMSRCIAILNLDLQDAAAAVGHHCVKKFGLCNREQ